jgi:hypothetical protein
MTPLESARTVNRAFLAHKISVSEEFWPDIDRPGDFAFSKRLFGNRN